jgi:pantetheine-phosphate adenylyltransferase
MSSSSLPRAIYAGSFDPITRGHLEVIRVAAPLFGELQVLVAINPAKKGGLFTFEERRKLILDSLDEVGIDRSDGHAITVAQTSIAVARHAADNGFSYLIRGVRPVSDFDTEFSLQALNRKIAPQVRTLFVPPPPDLEFGSSSAAKELVRLGEDASWLVTSVVAEALSRKHVEGIL